MCRRTVKFSAEWPFRVRPFVDEYVLEGKKLFALGEGRLIKLAGRRGPPQRSDEHQFLRPGARLRLAPLRPLTRWRGERVRFIRQDFYAKLKALTQKHVSG